MQPPPPRKARSRNSISRAALAIPASDRGWQTATRSVKCQSCQAISVFKPDRVAQTCDFCGSPALIPYDEIKAPIRPESLLPFQLSQSQVRDKVHEWYRTRWFAPNRFKSRAFTDTIHGLYLPYWTFDAQVAAQWTAEAGYYYYTTESYTDSKGNSQTRQVRHVRWEYASGALEHFFDDELVPASRGVPPDLLRRIEPFPTKELAPYDAGYVSGWVVEQYQIDLVAAAQASRVAMDNNSDNSAPARSRATPSATCKSPPTTVARLSSTFSSLSGCSTTNTAARLTASQPTESPARWPGNIPRAGSRSASWCSRF